MSIVNVELNTLPLSSN